MELLSWRRGEAVAEGEAAVLVVVCGSGGTIEKGKWRLVRGRESRWKRGWVPWLMKMTRGMWPSKKKNKNQKGERGTAAAPSGEGEERVQLLGFFLFFCVASP
ncbi:hypothetical protein Peur_034022 [Populus x canadensis]